MLGTFQHSTLRIEIDASQTAIHAALVHSGALRTWLWPQSLSLGATDPLKSGVEFTTWLGPIAICHHVDIEDSNTLRLILSQGIDGFHQWNWGDGWVQSQLEGISLLPLNLGQTVSLMRLRSYLQSPRA